MSTQPTSTKGAPVPPPSTWSRLKNKVYALVLIAIILVMFTISGLAYNQAFDGTVRMTVEADRAGLQMQAGNRVKVQGVDLGRVDSVRLNPDGEGVDIVLAVNPDLLAQVPTNVNVSLEQLTAFGSKAVQMALPENPSGEFLSAGSVIEAQQVSAEINTVFDELMTLLNRVEPAKLNTVTSALAETLRGNGEAIGTTIGQTNAYLKKFNTNLPQLQRDFRSLAGFSQVYADAGPDIADLLSNAGVIALTFDERRENFKRVLLSTETVGRTAEDFFAENAVPLVDTLESLRPFTSLLEEYAPGLTCFIDGAAVTYDGLNTKMYDEGGIQFEVNFVQPGSSERYHYPEDLPTVGPGPEDGPNCRGLPVVTEDEDSLHDYTTGPPSLNQRTTDNSPQPIQKPEQQTDPTKPLTQLEQFFGPQVSAPKAGN